MPQTEYQDALVKKMNKNRRLSRSNIDVFNLRNEKLSPLYQSSPGLYSPHKRSLESVQSGSLQPRSILVKKNLPNVQVLDVKPSEEKEEKISHFSLGFELQFTTFVLLCFVLIIVIPLSMIIVGSVYVTSCPKQMMIPVFLIVCGSSFLVSILLLGRLSRKSDTEFDKSCYKSTFSSSFLFQTIWFVAGCIWIYGAHEPEYNSEESPFYCDRTLYLFSFWLLNSIFLSAIISGVLFAIYVFFKKENSVDSPTKV